MHVKVNDTSTLKTLTEASAKLDTLLETATDAQKKGILIEKLFVTSLIERQAPKKPDNSVARARKLAGLTEGSFDDDTNDRYADPDSAFGASGRKDIDPEAVGSEDGPIKFPGVRAPHVGSGKPAVKPAMTRRQAAKNIDPKILAQLAGEDGGDDEAEAASDATPTMTAGTGPGPVSAAPLDGEAPVLNPGEAPAATAPANALARGEKAKKARDYLVINKGASRGEFMKFAARELGMTGAYANTLFYALKKRMAGTTPPEAAAVPVDTPMETWTIRNAKGLCLAEGFVAYDAPVWTPYDVNTAFEPRIFENERYAKKAIEALAKYGFHKVKAVKETF